MSHSELKAVFPGEKAEVVEEFKNSHGTAAFVWNILSNKYNGCSWICNTEKLWTIHKRQDVPMHQRMVMMMTYDNALIFKKDYAQAASDIRSFLADFPSEDKYANHWPRIAEILESSPEYPAVGFYMSSVGEDPFNGDWNEEKEDYDPPDWNKFWSVYDEPKGE